MNLLNGRQRVLFVALAAVVVLALASVAVAFAAGAGKSDLAKVKGAVAQYHRTEAAVAAGWVLVEGLDHCFEDPDAGGMGIHYINTALLDTALDPEQPEALVYQHKPNGELHLGAVEWIVPIALWEAEGHDMPPEVLGHHLHPNDALGVYVLHAWIFTKNPVDTFADYNPDVSCPDE